MWVAAAAAVADRCGCLEQGEAAACTVSGLRAGCIYRVRVRARNDSGYSPYSQPTDVGTAADVPGQPSAPAAISRTAHTISVTWEQPAHDGGSAVLSYRLELCRGGRERKHACYGRVFKLSPSTCKPFWPLVWLHICTAIMQRKVLPSIAQQDVEFCHGTQSDRQVMWLPVGPTENWNCGASKGKQKTEEVFSPVLLEDGGLGCHADIDSLDPGNEYLLRVIANNSLGSSPASAVGECLCPRSRRPSQDLSEGHFRETSPGMTACMEGGKSHVLGCNRRAGKVCTKAAPPLPPDPPHLATQAATANALQLAWSEPWGNGAPITNYNLEMAPADALLSQSRDPSQVRTLPAATLQSAQTPSHSLTAFELLRLLSHPCVNH